MTTLPNTNVAPLKIGIRVAITFIRPEDRCYLPVLFCRYIIRTSIVQYRQFKDETLLYAYNMVIKKKVSKVRTVGPSPNPSAPRRLQNKNDDHALDHST